MKITRLESELSRSNGISPLAAWLLLGLAATKHDGLEVERLDDEGVRQMLWLVHRGFAETDDMMGVMYVRITTGGRQAIEHAKVTMREARPQDPHQLPAPGVHTTNG